MKINGIETSSVDYAGIMIIGVLLITAVLVAVNYHKAMKIEQQQQRIIHLQQQAIKKANTIADVGEKDTQKGKRKTAAFTNNTEINSTEQNQ